MKKKAQKTKKQEKGLGPENTATPYYIATPRYIKSWGYYNKKNKILIERITPKWCLVNHDKDIFLAELKEALKKVDGKDKVVGYGFKHAGVDYLVKKLKDVNTFYNTPSLSQCEALVNKTRVLKPFNEIYEDVKKMLRVMFDFSSPKDVEITAITIAQSWIKPLLNSTFFYGIDATKGGGKTTLGELVYFLMRHGYVGGNITPAALVRLADDLDLNVFVDEIDQNLKDDDIMAALRKGQRRGNPYIRCEGKNNEPVAYDLFGCHGYSYRSDVEDAFMDRSLTIHTSKSQDPMLPVINNFKQEVLKPLADELFFWYFTNIHDVATCSGVAGCSSKYRHQTADRESLYKGYTKHLSTDDKTYLSTVFGRETELAYLCLNVSKMLGLDFLESLKEIMVSKKEDAASATNFYYDELLQYLHKNKATVLHKTLKDGLNAGCAFYPKSKLYTQFIEHLTTLKVSTIGTKKFSSLLRDFGFKQNESITSQRYDSYPTPCLIFKDPILKKLGLDEESKIREEFGG